MPDLFTLPEFYSYLQVPAFDPDTAALARDLATIAIREEVGPATYDLLDATGLLPFKPIALAVAKRTVWNPGGLRSQARQIDDYSENLVYATESLSDADLSDSERDRIAAILGRPNGAFTIRTPAVPFRAPECPGRRAEEAGLWIRRHW